MNLQQLLAEDPQGAVVTNMTQHAVEIDCWLGDVERARKRLDAGLGAGDLYDTAAPSADAQKLVNRTLLGLARDGVPVVAIAGNHDHAATIDAYRGFAEACIEVKAGLLEFLLDARRAGRRVAAYGAPAKGNTLLNYCGVGPELLPCTVDRSPHKQGRHLPGTHIPVLPVEEIARRRPDYLFILPWNLEREIVEQMAEIRSWGGKFVTPIPRIKVI